MSSLSPGDAPTVSSDSAPSENARRGPIVITGGGTAGHVLPALAIADGLREAGVPSEEIHYVGTAAGIENRLVPPTGYAATYLDVVGFQRSLSRRNLAFVPKLIASRRAAGRLLRDLQPSVVVNVGGYGSFPASRAAVRQGVPLVVVSYDLLPGKVSKMMAKRATLVAVSSPGSRLAAGPRARVTGAPVRPEMLHLDRAAARVEARRRRGLAADRFTVAVVGGSLGASALNTVVEQLVDRWRDRGDIAIQHVVGDRFLAGARTPLAGSDGIMYHVVGYEDDAPGLFAAADVVISRAGAGTLAELTTTGTPAIVVPWPAAAENHQVLNAREVANGVIVIEEAELSVGRLAHELESLHAHPEELEALARRARDAGAMHRSGRLVEAIMEVARR